MFDLKGALEQFFEGRTLDYSDVQQHLKKMRSDNFAELSPEISADDLLGIALRKGWVEEDQDGKLRVVESDRAA